MTAEQISTHLNSDDNLKGMLYIAWGFVPMHIIQAANNAGFFRLFETNDGKVIDIKAVSAITGWNEYASRIVLKLLEVIGVIYSINEIGITLTDTGKMWMRGPEGGVLGAYLPRQQHLEMAYRELDDILKGNERSPTMLNEVMKAFGGEALSTRKFLSIMHHSIEAFWPEVLKEINANFRLVQHEFLDVGCGSGTLALRLHDAFPLANIDAFDLPGVIKVTEENLAKYGKQRDINLIASDWRNWKWQQKKYDLIFLSQILHEFKEEEAEDLFENACYALNPGGIIIVIMVGDGDTNKHDLLHAIFSLNIYVENGGFNPNTLWLATKARKYCVYEVVSHGVAAGRSMWLGKRNSEE